MTKGQLEKLGIYHNYGNNYVLKTGDRIYLADIKYLTTDTIVEKIYESAYKSGYTEGNLSGKREKIDEFKKCLEIDDSN